MQDKVALQEALELMRDLRLRCEWDAAQTHNSLRPYLIEEAHELDAAVREGSDALMREELGDLLLQILFHSVIAEERGAFDLSQVAGTLIAKMKARHPHLYGDGVKEPWEKMKARKRTGITEGLPEGMPALHRAHRLQDRAAGVGFDWPDVQGPIAKVREELAEAEKLIEDAPVQFSPGGAPVLDARHSAIEEELGDLLFACVNLCRKAGVHASLALDKANGKFADRFSQVEALAAARGIAVGTAGLQVLDSLWDEVKASERADLRGEAG
jgi:MazG family protein